MADNPRKSARLAAQVPLGTKILGAGKPIPSNKTLTNIARSSSYGVLLVSSRPGTIAFLEDMLRRTGEMVTSAQTAVKAWEKMQLGTVGLVILDLCSPNLDHAFLSFSARTSPALSDISFVFLKNPEYKAPVLTMGPETTQRDAWLDMPCQERDLCILVTKLLQLRAYARLSRPQNLSVSASSANLQAISPMRADSSAQFPALLGGQIGTLDVPNILGMLAPMGLTGVLNIKSDKQRATINFVNGAVWDANVGTMSGSDALFVIFGFTQGKFTFDPADPPKTRTIQANTMGLLLEGLRQRDEIQRTPNGTV